MIFQNVKEIAWIGKLMSEWVSVIEKDAVTEEDLVEDLQNEDAEDGAPGAPVYGHGPAPLEHKEPN